MKKQEILEQLKAISRKIEDNKVEAWGAGLDDSSRMVILEDHQESENSSVEYNGWLEDLKSLINQLK